MKTTWSVWLCAVTMYASQLAHAAPFVDGPKLGELPEMVANGAIDVLTVQGNRVFMAGDFTLVDGTPAISIASWNGSRWSALGDGIVIAPATQSIDAIVEHDGSVYVGGKFSVAGGVAVHNIARWDGQRWAAVGSAGLANGGPAFVTSLAFFQGELHAAGHFEFSDGGPGNKLAVWDGQRWSRLGDGIANGTVSTLRVFRSELVAGGNFTEAGGVPALNLASWNGTRWAPLGNGVSTAISRMEANESHLIAATPGGLDATTLHRWDGASLTPLPAVPQSGFINELRDIAIWGTEIYFEGHTWSPRGSPLYSHLRWDGSEWSAYRPVSNSAIGGTLLANDRGVLSLGGNDLRSSGSPWLLSQGPDAGFANGLHTQARVSNDGQRVVFVSDANLINVALPFPGAAVYLRDRASGNFHRPSDLVLSSEPGHAQTFLNPAISGDGSTIAMEGSGGQIYVVRDGFAQLASRSANGLAGSAPSGHPALSRDGRYVAFDSSASNLTVDVRNSGLADVFVKDLVTGTVELISLGVGGVPANGSSRLPAINADGSVLAFVSNATNLVPPGSQSGVPQIVLATGTAGARRMILASRNLATGEIANAPSSEVRITSSGRFGVFTSAATNLVSDDTNGVEDIFRFEFDGNEITRLERVSVAYAGQQANGASARPSITDDGGTIAFDTAASNLVLVDRGGFRDVVRKRVSDGEVLRLAASSDGLPPTGQSFDAHISGDGSAVVFASDADNLVDGDNNAISDVFWAPRERWNADEPTVDRVALPVPNPPFANCPGGYFIAAIEDGAGNGVTAGLFGVAVQLLPGGSQRLEGGLNFGGLADSSQESFAGFNIQNAANEPQRLNLNLSGHRPDAASSSIPVRIQVIRQPAVGINEVIYNRTATLSMAAPLLDNLIVQPGFHVVTVLPLTGDNLGPADARIFVQLGTHYVDRVGGGFFGGVVVGGYHAFRPLGDVSGFAAFCLGGEHSASISTFGAPSYGSRGARDLRLRVFDYQRREIPLWQ